MSVAVLTTLAWVPPFARGLVRDVPVRWALEETGQPYEVRLLGHEAIKAAAHRCHQPFGQVPSYADETAEIFESGAIMLHVAERGPGLLPADPGARLRAIQWLMAALTSVEPWIMQLAAVNGFERDCAWSPLRRPKVIADLGARLGDLEAALGERRWLDGDEFTIGDLAMVWVLHRLHRTDMLADYPRTAAYVARGKARPAWQKAMADHLAVFETNQAAG